MRRSTEFRSGNCVTGIQAKRQCGSFTERHTERIDNAVMWKTKEHGGEHKGEGRYILYTQEGGR